VVTWSKLDDVAQGVLITASEGLVWEACAAWVPEPTDRGSAGIERTRNVVGRLMQLGLVWMYRLDDGNPELTEAEAVSVMNDQRRWVFDQGGPHDVAFYLTELGKKVYYSAVQAK